MRSAALMSSTLPVVWVTWSAPIANYLFSPNHARMIAVSTAMMIGITTFSTFSRNQEGFWGVSLGGSWFICFESFRRDGSDAGLSAGAWPAPVGPSTRGAPTPIGLLVPLSHAHTCSV